MAKFKCKVCKKKHKISSFGNAHKEIKCSNLLCPITNEVPLIQVETKQSKPHEPRQADLLEFDEYDEQPFNIITHFETEQPPKIIVQNLNANDFDGYGG